MPDPVVDPATAPVPTAMPIAVPENQASNRPGVQTSEWRVLLATVGTTLLSSIASLLPQPLHDALGQLVVPAPWNMVIAAAAAVGYILSRGIAKSGLQVPGKNGA